MMEINRVLDGFIRYSIFVCERTFFSLLQSHTYIFLGNLLWSTTMFRWKNKPSEINKKM